MKNPIITVSEMESTQLYKGVEDGLLFRRLTPDCLQKMVGGSWVTIQLTSDVLNSLKVTAYGKPAKNKLFVGTKTK